MNMCRWVLWGAGLFVWAGCVSPPEGPEYRINRCLRAPDPGNWEDPAWAPAETVELDTVYIATLFRPRVRVRMLYDDGGIYAIFHVEDQFLIARAAPQSDRISFDSCVELFLQRPGSPDYLCVEMAVSGHTLVYWCHDIHRGEYRKLPDADVRRIPAVSNRPGLRENAVDAKETWSIGVFIPFDVIARYSGAPVTAATLPREHWRGNFYKCAVWANPHWMSWAPLPEVDFHRPESFGTIRFE